MEMVNSTYKGLSVQRLSTGVIYSVVVVDPSGNSNSLEPDEYKRRGIMPPLEQLSDNGHE